MANIERVRPGFLERLLTDQEQGVDLAGFCARSPADTGITDSRPPNEYLAMADSYGIARAGAVDARRAACWSGGDVAVGRRDKGLGAGE